MSGADRLDMGQRISAVGAIGKRIKAERQRLGLTQHSVAVALGCRDATVSDWENGRHPIGADKLLKLSALGFVPDYVLFGLQAPLEIGVPPSIAPETDIETGLLKIIEHQTRTIEAHAATIRELCNRLAEAIR